jgi:hypothetical protein
MLFFKNISLRATRRTSLEAAILSGKIDPKLTYQQLVDAAHDPNGPPVTRGPAGISGTFFSAPAASAPAFFTPDLRGRDDSGVVKNSLSSNAPIREFLTKPAKETVVVLGPNYRPLGSATLISPHYVLTARHVLNDLSLSQIKLGFDYLDKTGARTVSCQLVEDGADFGLDYVILRLPEPEENYASIALSTPPNHHLILGFPKGKPMTFYQGQQQPTPGSALVEANELPLEPGLSGAAYRVFASGEVYALHMKVSESGLFARQQTRVLLAQIVGQFPDSKLAKICAIQTCEVDIVPHSDTATFSSFTTCNPAFFEKDELYGNHKELTTLHELNTAINQLTPPISGIDLSMFQVPGINRKIVDTAIQLCKNSLYDGMKRKEILEFLKTALEEQVSTSPINYAYDTHGDKHFPGGPPGTKFTANKNVVNPKLVNLITSYKGHIRRDANGKDQTYYFTGQAIPESLGKNITIQVSFCYDSDTLTYHGYPDDGVTRHGLSRVKNGPEIGTI